MAGRRTIESLPQERRCWHENLCADIVFLFEDMPLPAPILPTILFYGVLLSHSRSTCQAMSMCMCACGCVHLMGDVLINNNGTFIPAHWVGHPCPSSLIFLLSHTLNLHIFPFRLIFLLVLCGCSVFGSCGILLPCNYAIMPSRQSPERVSVGRAFPFPSSPFRMENSG